MSDKSFNTVRATTCLFLGTHPRDSLKLSAKVAVGRDGRELYLDNVSLTDVIRDTVDYYINNGREPDKGQSQPELPKWLRSSEEQPQVHGSKPKLTIKKDFVVAPNPLLLNNNKQPQDLVKEIKMVILDMCDELKGAPGTDGVDGVDGVDGKDRRGGRGPRGFDLDEIPYNCEDARVGTSSLVDGEAVVKSTAITDNSKVFLTSMSELSGSLVVVSVRDGVRFTVKSTNSSDNSSFNWFIVN